MEKKIVQNPSSEMSPKTGPRPPIVVVMGHVDHGKTTLLDYIRKTAVASREAGGITQSIGAYEITHQSQTNADYTQSDAEKISVSSHSVSVVPRKVTFIDTPGHEAFSKMRARGAIVADLAILVVAADDGVKPQTKEVIEVLNSTKTPFVVAINKIDKNNADIERTKNDLSQAGVFLEGMGGNISWQGISAKTGEGVNELLDLILLAAELEGLSCNPEGRGKGIVIEAKMDSRRGINVTVVIRDGTVRVGDAVNTQTASGKIKGLEDFLGERIKELRPSSPALIIGFDNLPQVGEEFTTGGDVESFERGNDGPAVKIVIPEYAEGTLLNILLKADVAGSLEAIREIIKTFPGIHIISESIGDITDGDVKIAGSTMAIIVGFKVKATKTAEQVSKAQNIAILTSDIIYELLQQLEKQVELLKTPLPQGEIQILAIFSQKGKKQLIGGAVKSGRIKNNTELVILREGNEVGSGRVTSIRQAKKEVTAVDAGGECGLMFESGVTVEVGDILVQPAIDSRQGLANRD